MYQQETMLIEAGRGSVIEFIACPNGEDEVILPDVSMDDASQDLDTSNTNTTRDTSRRRRRSSSLSMTEQITRTRNVSGSSMSEMEVQVGDEEEAGDENSAVDEERLAHGDGIFTRQNLDNPQGPRRKMKKFAKHIASTEVMRKIHQMMKKVLDFASFTPKSDKTNEFCNDAFLVHVRNVKMTKEVGGNCRIELREHEKTIVTIVARSEGHFYQMYRALGRSIIEEKVHKKDIC